MAICEKCIKQSVCKLCDGSEIMGCIEFVSLNKVIMNGQPLPDDCEILTREAYADLCMRASQEPRKGHWVTRPHVYGVTYCSECGFELKIDNTNYCPNCSADMREVRKHDRDKRF